MLLLPAAASSASSFSVIVVWLLPAPLADTSRTRADNGRLAGAKRTGAGNGRLTGFKRTRAGVGALAIGAFSAGCVADRASESSSSASSLSSGVTYRLQGSSFCDTSRSLRYLRPIAT